jgi:Family of unknown function (DUF5989)
MQGEPKAENGLPERGLHGGSGSPGSGSADLGSSAASDFRSVAGQSRPTLAREFVDFLGANKKWWLAPILLAILAIGALVVLGGSAAAPFIYTLF